MLQKIIRKLDNIRTGQYFLGVILLGSVLRLWGIFDRAIWYDEAFSLLFGQLSWGEMIVGTLGVDSTGAVAENHPLGYYFILKVWMDLLGSDVWAARALSVVFGIITLFIVYEISKLVFSGKKALMPVFVLAVSPFHIHYSQEIRMYALMALALIIATLALFKGMSEDRWYWWVIFAISSAVAQYTQQLAAIYLISLAAIPVLLRNKKVIVRVALSGGAAVLLYLPWLLHLPEQIASTKVYWVSKPLLSRFITLLITFVSGLPIRVGWTMVLFAVAMLVLVFGGMGTVRILKSEEKSEISVGWFAYLAFVPPVLLWLVSQVRPVFIERALLASAVMFSVWVGSIIASQLTPGIEKSLLAGLMLLGAFSGIAEHVEAAGFPYAPYQEIGQRLISELDGQENIIHSNKISFLPMYYYFGDEVQTFVADEEGSAFDTLALPTQRVLGFSESPSLEAAIGERDAFYFLIFQAAIDELMEAGLEEHPHLAWLYENYEVDSMETVDDLLIYHFTEK